MWAQQRAKRIKNVKKTQDTFDKKWDQGRKREEEAERKENWKKEHKRLKKQRRLEKKYGIKLEDSLDQSKEELPWKSENPPL